MKLYRAELKVIQRFLIPRNLSESMTIAGQTNSRTLFIFRSTELKLKVEKKNVVTTAASFNPCKLNLDNVDNR